MLLSPNVRIREEGPADLPAGKPCFLDVRQREVEGGERGQHQARVPGLPNGMAGDAPVRQTGQQTHVRPDSVDADIGKIAR